MPDDANVAEPQEPQDPQPGDPLSADTESRRRWMAVLARASLAELEAAYAALAPAPQFTVMRRPEPGLVMVRGRAGGTGGRFNLGEMSVTRCAVRLADGVVGVAYVAGRNRRHAELAAVFDGFLQRGGAAAGPHAATIARLAAQQQAAREAARRKAGATKVNFFTLVRGEDPR